MSEAEYIETRPGERIVVVCCDKAGCASKCDGLIQHKHPHTGEWGPGVDGALAACGWVTVDGKTFCGKLHADWYAVSRSRDPVRTVAGVTKLNDASYQARRTAPTLAPKPQRAPLPRT